MRQAVSMAALAQCRVGPEPLSSIKLKLNAGRVVLPPQTAQHSFNALASRMRAISANCCGTVTPRTFTAAARRTSTRRTGAGRPGQRHRQWRQPLASAGKTVIVVNFGYNRVLSWDLWNVVR